MSTILVDYVAHTMKKRGVLQLALRLNFWVAFGHLQFIIYTMQLTTIQLQLCHNNSFSTTMQLPYDYNHNVMMTSFSSIHQNLTRGTIKIFYDFFEILISIVHYDYSFYMVLDYDTWHNQKLPCGIFNWILETYIYIYR